MHALAIAGSFDDCQAIVKGMFNHHAFCDRVRLSGVNSINWARIIAQIVYYFTSAVALGSPLRKVAFTVPTGNFGNIYAGYVALRMGLPIDRLVIATNVNDILTRTIATGSYDLREVVATTSPSMDIQIASNFERLLFEVYGRDSASGTQSDGTLAQSGRFTLSAQALSAIRDCLLGRPRRRRGDCRQHANHVAGNRTFHRSAHRSRSDGKREGDARSRNPDGGAWQRRTRQSSRCGRGCMRIASPVPEWLADLEERRRTRQPRCRRINSLSRSSSSPASRAAQAGAAI